jgi:hypothetical protein
MSLSENAEPSFVIVSRDAWKWNTKGSQMIISTCTILTYPPRAVQDHSSKLITYNSSRPEKRCSQRLPQLQDLAVGKSPQFDFRLHLGCIC